MKIDFNTKRCELRRCHPGEMIIYDNNLWAIVNRNEGQYFLREMIVGHDQKFLMAASDLVIDLILQCNKIGARRVKRCP